MPNETSAGACSPLSRTTPRDSLGRHFSVLRWLRLTFQSRKHIESNHLEMKQMQVLFASYLELGAKMFENVSKGFQILETDEKKMLGSCKKT